MKKKYFAFFLCSLAIFFSCQNEESIFDEDLNFTSQGVLQGITSLAFESDTIVEIQLSDLSKKKSFKIKTYSYGDDSGIDGIVGMPVNLVIKQNPYGTRYVTYKGVNAACKLENASSGNNQKFFLRKMPLTGLFYFTPYDNSSYLLSAGTYSNNPNVHVLYVKNSTSSLGATWDICKGTSDNYSFVLKNEDVLEQGTGYSLALGVNTNNGNLNFSKYYSGRRTQEFEIKPCDEFIVTEMSLSQYGTSSITDIPDFVATESYRL
jgi:hypothetical protein